jgi:hypothetical protein
MKVLFELKRSSATAIFVLIATTTVLVLEHQKHGLSVPDNVGGMLGFLGTLDNPWKLASLNDALTYVIDVTLEGQHMPGYDTRRLLALNLEQDENNEKQNHMQHRSLPEPNDEMQDATFNGIPLVHHPGKPRSSVYCIEEGQQSGGTNAGHRQHDMDKNVSWMFRSCRFEYLCFDVTRQDYVVFRNAAGGGGGGGNDESNNDLPNQRPLESYSTFSDLPTDNETLSVALGGINPRWLDQRGFDKGAWKVRWFPTILPDDFTTLQDEERAGGAGYYTLPDHHILVPFHSFAGHNVGTYVY